MSTKEEVIQPFRHLCGILKSIGDSAATTNEAGGGEDGPGLNKASEAADIVLGLSKIMQKATAGDNNGKDDLSCIFCRKKCNNKREFLAHFRSHLKKGNNNNGVGDDDNGGCDETDEDEDLASAEPVRKRRKCYNKRNVMQRKTHSSKNPRKPGSEDADSGCHSVESEDQVESDCFLGDSESSESDENDENLLERLHQQSRNGTNNKAVISRKDRLSLAEKQLDNNETEGLICLTCLKRFSNCQNLRRHLRLHIARDSITPDIDKAADGGDVEGRTTSLGKHMCDWCPARFDNRAAARVHESSHKGQEPRCYVCDKRYADRYSLRYHLRTHGIGRQIRCEYCNKSFSKPSRLDSHVRSHHDNIRDFKCGECGKAFKTRLHLENHTRQHSGERPFQCQVCGDRFRHKTSLVTHSRSHEGLRPFCCEVCGKTFREPSTLKAHSRVHTGARPYSCEMCGKSFTQRAGLSYHMKALHSSEKPFKCRLCHYQTAKSSSLSGHYRNVHQILEVGSGINGVNGGGGERKESRGQEDNDEVVLEVPKSHPPLPSPPVQSGDAVFREKVDTVLSPPLPSFDHLRPSPSSANSSPARYAADYASVGAAAAQQQQQQHYEDSGSTSSGNETPPLTPPASASTTSSSASSSSAMENLLQQQCSMEAEQDFAASAMSGIPDYDYGAQQQQQQHHYSDYHRQQQQLYLHQQHQQQYNQMFHFSQHHHHSPQMHYSGPQYPPTASSFGSGASYYSSSCYHHHHHSGHHHQSANSVEGHSTQGGGDLGQMTSHQEAASANAANNYGGGYNSSSNGSQGYPSARAGSTAYCHSHV